MTQAHAFVSGGSGFIAVHLMAQLIARGQTVHTTLRTASRRAEVVDALVALGLERTQVLDHLHFFTADLLADAGWEQAVRGCEEVYHLASPFPAGIPKDPEELIRPARDGALRVLGAARGAGARRVVLTSSFAAIGYGHGRREELFTEKDWTNLASNKLSAYARSKTIAERAAWQFIEREGGGLELATVNPVGIFGPVTGRDLSTSTEIIRRLLEGKLPGAPDIWFGAVDVRDVADLHVRAMRSPVAAGERYLAMSGEPVSVHQIALLLRQCFGPVARRVTTRRIPSWQVRLAALFNPLARTLVPDLGLVKRTSNEKARKELGWQPRPAKDALVATADSLLRLKLVEGV